MKSRMTSLFIFVGLLLGTIVLRTAYLQFVPQDRLNALQEKQFQTIVNLPSRRGSILDRNAFANAASRSNTQKSLSMSSVWAAARPERA